MRRLAGTLDAELAQRAVEYRGLAARREVARAAVQPLPKWEKRTSLLLRRLAEKEVRGAQGHGRCGRHRHFVLAPCEFLPGWSVCRLHSSCRLRS